MHLKAQKVCMFETAFVFACILSMNSTLLLNSMVHSNCLLQGFSFFGGGHKLKNIPCLVKQTLELLQLAAVIINECCTYAAVGKRIAVAFRGQIQLSNQKRRYKQTPQ